MTHNAYMLYCQQSGSKMKGLQSSREQLVLHLLKDKLPSDPNQCSHYANFFSVNQRFVGARANTFWQYNKLSFRKFNKFVKIWHFVYFNTGLVQNLGHLNVFLHLRAQLFPENLGTR